MSALALCSLQAHTAWGPHNVLAQDNPVPSESAMAHGPEPERPYIAGASVGAGRVVAPGGVFPQDLPSNVRVAGGPAKIVKHLARAGP